MPGDKASTQDKGGGSAVERPILCSLNDSVTVTSAVGGGGACAGRLGALVARGFSRWAVSCSAIQLTA
jgi:hypothetical protein